MRNNITVALISTVLLTACNNDDDNTPSDADIELREIIQSAGLTGSPFTTEELTSLPDISDPDAQLGKRLFFSKSLSGDRDTACVTCHHPTLGGGDNLSLPIGVAAVEEDLIGPGRMHDPDAAHNDLGPTVPRNAPTTFNLAAWETAIFHDGRLEALTNGIRTPDSSFGVADPLAGDTLAHAQARFPVTSPEEMKGFNFDALDNQGIRDYLASRLGGYGAGAGDLTDNEYWLAQFRTVFSDAADTPAENVITEQRIFQLISIYERSQIFVDTPWKSYVEGNNNAISSDAKAGALLFFGNAGCSSCHSGDFFTDERFHNIAAPQIGRGKGHGTGEEDFGRSEVSGDEADKFKFRTPSLVNVEVTGPWTHAGAYTTLEATVRHHLNPQTALDNYDYDQLGQDGIQNLDKTLTNTQKAIDALTAERASNNTVLELVSLTDQEVNQVVSFLKSLTDPCVKSRSCLADWIADEIDDADPNGDLQVARDASGTVR